MRTRLVTVLASLFVVLSVLGATPASANSTPGLVEKYYYHLSDTLTRVPQLIGVLGHGWG
jgi:hypothetical protein